MSLMERSREGVASLSGHLGAALRRRLRELSGIALLSLPVSAGLALATWSEQGPSLSHATNATAPNLLGVPGAPAADLLMQLFGLGSLALLLPLAIWGYRLIGHRPLNHERVRITLWAVGTVLGAAFASCLPRTAHWPLPSGLGGVIGDALLRLPDVLLRRPPSASTSPHIIAAIVLGIAALVAFAGAAGMIWRGATDDEDDEPQRREGADDEDEGGWISLGWLFHAALSLRARLV